MAIEQLYKVNKTTGQKEAINPKTSSSGVSHGDSTVETVLNGKANTNHSHDNYVEKETGKSLFSGSYSDLTDVPQVLSSITQEKISQIDTNKNSVVSLSTQIVNLETNKVDKVNGKGLSSNDYTNEDKAKVQSALQSHQSLTDYAKKAELFSGSYNDLEDKPTLFNGDYESLTNKPTIPSQVTDEHINSLIDAKIGSLETLANSINELVGGES